MKAGLFERFKRVLIGIATWVGVYIIIAILTLLFLLGILDGTEGGL
jgi:hypothetical protein